MQTDTLKFYDLSTPLPKNWWGGNTPRPPIASNKTEQRKFERIKREWNIAKKLRDGAQETTKGDIFDDDDIPIATVHRFNKINKRNNSSERRNTKTNKRTKTMPRTKTEHVTITRTQELSPANTDDGYESSDETTHEFTKEEQKILLEVSQGA